MKSKKILLIIIPVIIVIALVIAAILFILLNLNTFKPANQLFFTYLSQNSKLATVLTNENSLEQKDSLLDGYVSNGNLSVTIEDANQNLKELKAVTKSQYDAETKRTYAEMAIKQGEQELTKASFINSGNVYSIKWDDILGYYIGISTENLQDFFKNAGITSETMPIDIPENFDLQSMDYNKMQISKEQANQLAQTYKNVFVQTIPEQSYAKLGKTNITIEGKTFIANGYSLTLTPEIIKNLLTNLLTTVKTDNLSLEIIDSILNNSNVQANTNEQQNMQEQLTQAIDEIIAKIQEAEITENIVITVYENNEKLVKTTISTPAFNIHIDNIQEQNRQKVAITVDAYELYDNNTSAQGSNDVAEPITFKITFEKYTTQTATENFLELSYDNDMSISIHANLGKNIDGKINNSTEVFLKDGSGTTTTAVYDREIEVGKKGEAIMELLSSNSYILNNYPQEQLQPFMAQLVQKTTNVLNDKVLTPIVQNGTIKDTESLIKTLVVSIISLCVDKI